MSSTEGMINGGSSSANPKAPAPAPTEGNGGFVSQHKMSVEPPKKEDLQRKYATVVEHEAGTNDWYGSMSKYCTDSYHGVSS